MSGPYQSGLLQC